MPSTTANLGLTLPLGGDAPSELRIAITNNANLLDGYSLLTSVVANAISATVVRGQTVIASPGTTQTLPAASANALVAVVASTTVTGASPVTVAGSQIYGIGLANPASSFLLGTPGAFTVLQSDGTHWYIVGGQQDTGWVALTLAASITAQAGTWTPAARLIGDRVTLRGAVTGTGINVTTALPAAFQPPGGITAYLPISNSGAAAYIKVAGSTIFGGPNSNILPLDGISWTII